MTETYVVHEINCEDSIAHYRPATDEEIQNSLSQKYPELEDTKLSGLKEAAKQSSPEMYNLVMYLLGGGSDAHTE